MKTLRFLLLLPAAIILLGLLYPGTYRKSTYAKRNTGMPAAILPAEQQPVPVKPEDKSLPASPAHTLYPDLRDGEIGHLLNGNADDPYDNVFHFTIGIQSVHDYDYWLEYDLKGVKDYHSLARSVNHSRSAGALRVQPSGTWTHQREPLQSALLKPGANVVIFTLPDSADVTASIRSLKLSVRPRDKQADAPAWPESLGAAPENRHTYHPSKESETRLEQARLHLPEKALKKKTELQIRALDDAEAVPTGADLVNVTAAHSAYRFLPDGTRFEKEVTLELGYDPALIPEGYTADDIRTYYFDTHRRQWIAVHSTGVNPDRHTITSRTNHFTDYINGIIKVPESPETMGYTPTSIKDYKAGDVSSMIPPLSPPEPNNNGSVITSFPIKLPPGRQGLQPNMALSYSSEGGNGILGLGWNIPFSSITIDTRWGVPRYDAGKETETYLLDGQQLTGKNDLDIAHREWVSRSSGSNAVKEFKPRVEQSFRKIVRRGGSPATYRWEVTDKDGTVYYYGTLNGTSVENTSVLRDGTGGPTRNIAKWNLMLVKDLNGNTIRYHNRVVSNPDVSGGNSGRQLYVDRITYTGHNNTEGSYEIKFVYDEKDRKDVLINCRLGLKEVTARRLSGIIVSYKGGQVRRYKLEYKEGAFFKSLLEYVTEYDAEDQPFYTYGPFEYYDEVRNTDGNYVPYGIQLSYNQTTTDDINIEFTKPTLKNDNKKGSFLGSSLSSNDGWGIYVGVGPNIYRSTKNFTVGYSFNKSSSEARGMNTLMDIDGDGRPDKVIQKEGNIFYRLNQTSPAGQVGFGEQKPLNNSAIRNFAFTTSTTKTQGPQALAGMSFTGKASIGLSAGSMWSKTRSETKTYLVDRNGDGLLDICSSNLVYFNQSQPGSVNFGLQSGNTANLINTTSSPNIQIWNQDDRDALITENPLHDVVRVWTAPYNGRVRLNSQIELILDGDAATYPYRDGIYAAIEYSGVILDSTRLKASGQQHSFNNTVDINKGDRIFFRLSSIIDGMYDKVQWDPKIEYINNEYVSLYPSDPNRKNLFKYSYSEDFLVNMPQYVYLEKGGQISIDGRLTIAKPLSDIISLEVIRFDSLGSERQTIVKRNIPGNTVENDSLVNLVDNFSVDTAGNYLLLKVSSPTQIDWQSITWKPRVYFTHIEGIADPLLVDSAGQPLYVFNPMAEYTMFNDNVAAKPGNSRPRMVQPFYPDSNGIVEVHPEFIFYGQTAQGLTIPVPAKANGSITVSAKSANRLIARKTYSSVISQYIDYEDNPLSFPVNSSDTIFLEVFVSPRQLYDSLSIVGLDNVKVKYFHDPFPLPLISPAGSNFLANNYGLYTTPDTSRQLIFGPSYRQWGQFCYNPDALSAGYSDPIRNEHLKYDIPDNAGNQFPPIDDPGNPPVGNMTPIEKQPFIYMTPAIRFDGWAGYDDLTWIKKDILSASRLGEDNMRLSSIPSIPDGMQGIALLPDKISRTKSHAVNAGISGSISFFSGNLGGSSSDGDTKSLLEVMDMNGDRYPDLVSEKEIQYTGLAGNYDTNTIPGSFAHSSAHSASGMSAGGSYAYSHSINSGSKPGKTTGTRAEVHQPEEQNAQLTDQQNTASLTVGISASGGASLNRNAEEVQSTWMDINGDGLPDKIWLDSLDNQLVMKARLNIGYGFLPAETWPGVYNISKSKSKDGSISADLAGSLESIWDGENGKNAANGSISFGMSAGYSESRDSVLFLDINNDNLPDQIICNDEGDVQSVRLNLGSSFSAPLNEWSVIKGLGRSKSHSESENLAATLSISFWLIKISINPSINWGKSISRSFSQFADIDGDGYADYLTGTLGDDTLRYRLSTIGRTNLLKAVHGPFGSSFRVTYKRTPNSYEMPDSRWVMDSLFVFDGHEGDGVSTYAKAFRYEGGRYDRREREFYGFYRVIAEDLDQDGKVYRRTTTAYDSTGYYTKGLVVKRTLVDASGKKYVETINTYQLRQDLTPVSANSAGTGDHGWAFPALLETRELHYEGQPTPGIQKRTSFGYDAVGNVTRFTDHGNGADDEYVEASVQYYDQPAYIPSEISISDIDGTILRKRTQERDVSNGNIKNIKHYIDAQGTQHAPFDFGYDPYGNLTKVTRPANANGERMEYNYTYDDSVHSHVTGVKDAFGYTSSSEYDYRFGQVIKTTDINKQLTSYTVDAKGRVTSVQGPYEKGDTLTINIEYITRDNLPYSVVTHFDPEHSAEGGIKTVTFMDGLFRPVQVKKTGVVTEAGQGEQLKYIVSGKIIYDAFGRATEARYPTLQGYDDPGAFSNDTDPIPPTVTTYDVLDRKLSETLPDGAKIQMKYTLETDNNQHPCFKTEIRDAKGNESASYTDARGRELAKYAVLAGTRIWTNFDYSPVSDINSIRDHRGNAIRYTYDLLGRKLSYTHPDAGLTEYSYDPAGNLTQKITPNLRALFGDKGAISYRYEFNRLMQVDYPINYQNRVKYHYGGPGAPHNRAGRVWLQEDASGGQEFFYGRLGEVEKTIRTIVISRNEKHTYIYAQTYDTWNRIQTMSYPDGEKVDYRYNRAGKLHSMTSKKDNYDYTIIGQLGYDKFEQRTFLKYGNGTTTEYAYDTLRRLGRLSVTAAGSRKIMDNAYTYDAVSNITRIVNAAQPKAGELGGTARYDYTYDDLYRLTKASGHYSDLLHEKSYALSMAYDELYNITGKQQELHEEAPSAPTLTSHPRLNYTHAYSYDPDRPHVPLQIGNKTYTYDPNGNMTGWQEDDPSLSYREIFWDEENRIQKISDDGNQSLYTYDAGGERVLKSEGPSEGVFINGAPIGFISHNTNYTAYVSPYMVVRAGGFTKHYYAESQRVLSRQGTGGFMNGPFMPPSITAGSLDYLKLVYLMEQAAYKQYQEHSDVPGHPSRPFADQVPQQSGEPVELGDIGDYSADVPPEGWPVPPPPPQYNATDPPGHPTQNVPHTQSDDALPGYLFKNDANSGELNQYYYHPDHLGSSSYITDATGRVRQHMEYTAFGESFVDEHSNSPASPYLFNAKELDEQTGLYYYGARYYDPKTSIWASVDPMAEKYPGVSPFNYCLNNPIMSVDPDGNFALSIHKDITYQAMAGSGILPKTSSLFQIDLVLGATINADILGAASDWHFDGRANYSAVQARWSSLNQDITTTIGDIGGGNKLLGGSDVSHLGKLIHNIQDFYSHSNYVELYIEYYKGANNGALPTSVPIYDEGIKNADFNGLLKDKLRTGDFHLLDNEKVDLNPFREHANKPTSHNKMNKDNANTYPGKLAKQAAIDHATKSLKEVE